MALLSLLFGRRIDPSAERLPVQNQDWFRRGLRREGWQVGETWMPLIKMVAQRPNSPTIFVSWEFGPLEDLLLNSLNVTGGASDKAVVIFTAVHAPDYLQQAAAAQNVLLIRYDDLPRLPERVAEMKAMLQEERRRAQEANAALPSGPSEAEIESKL